MCFKALSFALEELSLAIGEWHLILKMFKLRQQINFGCLKNES